MPGFDNAVCYGKNVDFSGSAIVAPTMTTDGQLLIGTTTLTPGGTHIKVGKMFSPNATILFGYNGTDITADTGPVAAVTVETDSGNASPIGNVLKILGLGSTTTSGDGTNQIFINSSGGGGSATNLGMQTGTAVVVPTGGGIITLNGAVVSAGTNPIRTDGTGANTATIEVQKSQAIAAADATKIGLSNFNSFQFNVTDGFVTLAGGMAPPALFLQGDDSVNVGPNGSGVIALTGNVVANGTHAKGVFVVNNAVNSERIDVQLADDIAATDVTKVGLAAFDSADFTVDGNGFVSLSASVPTTDLHTARYIVSAGGTADGANYTTIATAYAAAVLAGGNQTVFIQPKSTAYSENLTLSPNVNLAAYSCDADTPNVTILGKLSYSSAGSVSISGIRLQTNSDNFLAVTGSAASVVNLENCYLNCSNATGISFTSSSGSSQINVFRCRGDIGTTGISLFSSSSAGNLTINYCYIPNSGNTVTSSTISAGILFLHFNYFEFPITTSGTNSYRDRMCHHNTSEITPSTITALTVGGSGTNFAINSTFTSAGSSAVSTSVTMFLQNCAIRSQNANSITGVGTLNYSGLAFDTTTSTINVTTQNPFVEGPRIRLGGSAELMSGSGSPSGVVTAPQGTLYLRTDGSSSSTRAYVNSNGGSAWVNITTSG